MDKQIIIQALNKAFLSEAESTPAISLANKLSKENGKINKAGVTAVAKDMTEIEKDQEKGDMNQKTMAKNKFPAEGKDKTYHEEMEIMNGQEMIEYDRDPNQEFKDRAMEAIEGSARMGNDPNWANVVAKGQGGDPEFGKNLVKKIKASQKKRVEQTPTTKMYGDDWEVIDDTSHKKIAVESRNVGKKPLNESNAINRKYTHFLVYKPNGKIVDGWDYKGVDVDEIKDWVKIDMNDNDNYGFAKKDFKLATAKNLINTGLDPFDMKSWFTERFNNTPVSEDKDEKPVSDKEADVAGDNYEDSDRAAQAGTIRYENNKKTPQIKESMKRITFKKEFNGVGNALKLIPESYKVDMKVFEMTDKNETYKIRWEGSLTEGKAIVLTAANKSNINEDIQRMKHLFNYKSEDTLGTVKGKARLDETAAFADVWSKTKALLTEEGDIENAPVKTGEWDKIKPSGAGAAQPKLQSKDGTAPAPKTGEWDEISVPASTTSKIKSQAKGTAPTTAKTSGDLDDAVDYATKEIEPEAKKKLQEKDGTAPAPATGDLDDAVDYATKEIEPEAKKKLQTKDGTAPAPKNGNWEDASVPQAADAKKHVTMNEEIDVDGEEDEVEDDAYNAGSSELDVPDVDDMQPSNKDIAAAPSAPAKFVGNDDADDEDEDDVVVPTFNKVEAKLVKSQSREGVYGIKVMRNGQVSIVDIPTELVNQAKKNPQAVLAQVEADKLAASNMGNGLNEEPKLEMKASTKVKK